VQVDPIKSALKSPVTERLKLKYDGPLSNLAFTFHLRCYILAADTGLGLQQWELKLFLVGRCRLAP
jgi:hypothetical protein